MNILNRHNFSLYCYSCVCFRNMVTPFRWMVSTLTTGLVTTSDGASFDFLLLFVFMHWIIDASFFSSDIPESGFDIEAWGFGNICCEQANTKQTNLVIFTCEVLQRYLSFLFAICLIACIRYMDFIVIILFLFVVDSVCPPFLSSRLILCCTCRYNAYS